jgi:hypothetical protein
MYSTAFDYSLYMPIQFKGWSSPLIALFEIDFTDLSTRELEKLFVGISRAEFEVVFVISE